MGYIRLERGPGLEGLDKGGKGEVQEEAVDVGLLRLGDGDGLPCRWAGFVAQVVE